MLTEHVSANHNTEIVVNGRPRNVAGNVVSFEQVVELAFPDDAPNPDRIYTVAIRHGARKETQRMFRVIRSTSAATRLAAAAHFLETRPPFAEVATVGASRGAADDLARAIARRRGATFGIQRFSLTELAARAAAVGSQTFHTPATQAAGEAMAARAIFDATAAAELTYFEPVAKMPGFPKALARTVH